MSVGLGGNEGGGLISRVGPRRLVRDRGVHRVLMVGEGSCFGGVGDVGERETVSGGSETDKKPLSTRFPAQSSLSGGCHPILELFQESPW